jgi:hypothetical protein
MICPNAISLSMAAPSRFAVENRKHDQIRQPASSYAGSMLT